MRSTDNQWSHQRVQDGRFWWILEIIPILLYNWSTYVRTYVYVQDREQRKESAGNLVKVSFPNRYSLPESWSEDPILSNLHKVRKYNIMPYDTGKKTIPFLHTEWGRLGPVVHLRSDLRGRRDQDEESPVLEERPRSPGHHGQLELSRGRCNRGGIGSIQYLFRLPIQYSFGMSYICNLFSILRGIWCRKTWNRKSGCFSSY